MSESPSKRSIHVFTSDILPFPGCPRTAGGNRSQQIISALRAAGHKVTLSMSLNTFLAKKNLDRIRSCLSAEELWACEYYDEPEIVLNRIEPDIAIHCNINCFRTLSHYSRDIVHIADFYGPVQFEELLLTAVDYETALLDGAALENRCHRTIEKLRQIDYLVTVSERQKYFWSAYCSLAGFSFADIDILVCPAAFDFPPVTRTPAQNLTVVYSGGFYPWQNPDRFLRTAAAILDEMEGAILHVFGGPHSGMSNEQSVNQMLQEIQEHRCVKYHGYRPVEEVTAVLSTAWCALELMEQNVERELAVTGRTLEFLASGVPVIYNNYSTLSGLIQKYEAGWTLPASNAALLGGVFTELASGGLPLVEKLSRNARRLSTEEFSGVECMRPLQELCLVATSRRSKRQAGSTALVGRSNSLGRVLGITPDAKALRELRVSNPLRALQRQGYIDGMTVAGIYFPELKNDKQKYNAILIQRAVPEFIFETLRNLSLPFLLDCDDNILARAAYRDAGTEENLLTGLRYCSGVTAPNPRLIRGFERYSSIPLMKKGFITPNALPFVSRTGVRAATQPSQILWIQSDIAALTNSREAIMKAVDDFSQRHSLPIVLIGANVLARPQFKNQVVMGEIDFTSNLQFLEFAASSIGVAPLETDADPGTLDFVAGKSDLKMLLFAGYGHAGVYSDAPPYNDSPLGDELSVVPNDYHDWVAALEYQYLEGWRKMPALAEHIQTERHIDRVARECWRPALLSCLLPSPVTGADLYEAFNAARQMDRTVPRSIAYMVSNWDVARNYVEPGERTAWDHYVRYGRTEERVARYAPEANSKFLEKISEESIECVTRGREKMREQRVLVESLRKEIGTFETQRNNLRGKIRTLEEEVGTLRGLAGKLERDLSLAHQTLIGMEGSKSWRITAPLRKAIGLFRNR